MDKNSEKLKENINSSMSDDLDAFISYLNGSIEDILHHPIPTMLYSKKIEPRALNEEK